MMQMYLICSVNTSVKICRNLGPELNAGHSFVKLVVSIAGCWVFISQFYAFPKCLGSIGKVSLSSNSKLCEWASNLTINNCQG